MSSPPLLVDLVTVGHMHCPLLATGDIHAARHLSPVQIHSGTSLEFEKNEAANCGNLVVTVLPLTLDQPIAPLRIGPNGT